MSSLNPILKPVSSYYSAKLKEHGDTARGVDWNGEESQSLRFEQLLKVTNGAFSVNDVGCGYGALFEYLQTRYTLDSYLGVDISGDMINAAIDRYGHHARTRFVVGTHPDAVADYCMASGIFNVRLEHGDEAWKPYIESTLDILDRTSRRGFAFNCLSSYSDSDKMKDYLYYANPFDLFDLCKRKYARNVALLHDYSLYEFTILVRKV